MTKARLLTPDISTGGRSVFPKGKNPAPFVWALLIVPAVAFAIAFADSRIGFKLFMASVGITMLILVVALYFRSRALRSGTIRIADEGELRFVPPGVIRAGNMGVAIAFLIPAVASLIITLLDLPTQQGFSRLTVVGPYLLAAVGIWLLVKEVLSERTPAGLQVDADGLSGVRGTKRVDLRWEDLENATAFGRHGPKLMLLSRNQGPLILESHHFGSDPAIVAEVIEYFKANPTQRAQLVDGAAAIRTVETVRR